VTAPISATQNTLPFQGTGRRPDLPHAQLRLWQRPRGMQQHVGQSSRLRTTVAAQQPGAMNHRIGRTLHHNNHNVCQ
jgi:hypothetical protein